MKTMMTTPPTLPALSLAALLFLPSGCGESSGSATDDAAHDHDHDHGEDHDHEHEAAAGETDLTPSSSGGDSAVEPLNRDSTGGESSSGGTVSGSGGDEATPPAAVRIRGEVWGDNWSAFYLGEQLIMEDSVSITTERSFNAEVFDFEGAYPLSFNFVLKDFVETNSGLEYIGQSGSAPGEKNQQIGDGGYIAQFTDRDSGEVIAVTDESLKCLVIYRAPLNPSCESSANPDQDCQFERFDEPADWKTPDFDDSSWNSATVWSEEAVSPKDGYDEIVWHEDAELIWGSDLRLDNTVLCRLTVQAP